VLDSAAVGAVNSASLRSFFLADSLHFAQMQIARPAIPEPKLRLANVVDFSCARKCSSVTRSEQENIYVAMSAAFVYVALHQ
jgi:hypothetical protein